MYDVLVVGAGITGLTCARLLRDRGARVLVLDKGRAPGGRLSSRRLDDAVLDTGAIALHPEDADTAAMLTSLVGPELLPAAAGELHLADPDALIRALAETLTIQRGFVTHVDLEDPQGAAVVCEGTGERFVAGQVVLTMPVPQALALLRRSGVSVEEGGSAPPDDDTSRPHDPETSLTDLAGVRYHRTTVLLVRLASPLAADAVQTDPYGVVARVRDEHRRGRSPVPAITVHATPTWSERTWEADLNDLRADLLAGLQRCAPTARVARSDLKRWRYASPATPLRGAPYRRLGSWPLLLAGDGFGGSDETAGAIDQALCSARALAAALR